jgi:hypothetical protein
MSEAHALLSLDGRQSLTAAAIQRGACRLLRLHGYATLPEVTLADGHRADILALGKDGELCIVEIKSSLEDFRSDRKWQHYCSFCDRLYFATTAAFDHSVLPEDHGLIVADRFGGEYLRHPQVQPLNAARRKAVIMMFARIAASRLHAGLDPEFSTL